MPAVEQVRIILERTFGFPVAESDAQIVLDRLTELARKEAVEQSVHWTGGDSVGFCELHQISFLQAECPRCHPASQ